MTFTYATTADRVTSTNWVGIYSDPGNGPVDGSYVGPSTTWQYVTQQAGSVDFGSGSLTPGKYLAFYLYNDGYTALADPVRFTVTPVQPMVPPVYVSQLRGQLREPAGVAVDSRGFVWVADTGHHQVAVFAQSGRSLLRFGRAGTGPGQFCSPQSVAVSATGRVFVADTGNDRVQEFSAYGRYIATYGQGQLLEPRSVALSGDLLYVSDSANVRVAVFSTVDRTYQRAITAKMGGPQGIAVGPDGTLWVAQNGTAGNGDDAVVSYSPAGVAKTTLGAGQNSQYGGMSNPAAVGVDPAGHLLVSQQDYGFVQIFRASGPFLAQFGDSTDAGMLKFPQAIAFAANADILVADSGHDRIAVFRPQKTRGSVVHHACPDHPSAAAWRGRRRRVGVPAVADQRSQGAGRRAEPAAPAPSRH